MRGLTPHFKKFWPRGKQKCHSRRGFYAISSALIIVKHYNWGEQNFAHRQICQGLMTKLFVVGY